MPATMPAQPLMPLIPSTPALRDPPAEPAMPGNLDEPVLPAVSDLPTEYADQLRGVQWPVPLDGLPYTQEYN